MPLLAVEQLRVQYRAEATPVTAVHDVSFTVEPGEVVALVGESGSGKSSVALALTRLLPPTASVSGRVLFQGRDLLTASPAALRAVRGGQIAYVFQDPSTSLNPVLTVEAQLTEALQWHQGGTRAEVLQRAVGWLEQVGIPQAASRLKSFPHELSGGMQQRVMIAMAMATAPALLVADEPTTALDVTVQVQILRLLRQLQQQHRLSVLLVSHDLAVVERIAHKVGVMSQGRLVEWGEVRAVLQAPQHPYTRQLLAYRTRLTLPGAGGRHA
jgi:microcin C transport system ATP-binding protein